MSARAEVGDRPRIAVSGCLLGEDVRFNGGHCRDRFVTDSLAEYLEFVSVCPEVEAGLGIPRPTIRLMRRDDGVRVEESASGTDHTEALRAASQVRSDALRSLGIQGAVLKKGSPSCGLERVKIYQPPPTMPESNGRGVFAQALTDAMPGLPMEEDGRLNDPVLRDRFLTRLYARHRLDTLFASPVTQGRLVAFHSREKLLLMAYSLKAYKALGPLVAHAKGGDSSTFEAEYRAGFEEGLAAGTTRGRQVNVLQHIAGYFKKQLEPEDRKALSDAILGFQAGEELMVEPWTLLRHYVRHFKEEYLATQTFLDPYPLPLRRAVLVKLG